MAGKDLDPILRGQIEEILRDGVVRQAERSCVGRIEQPGRYKFIFSSSHPRFEAEIPWYLSLTLPGITAANIFLANIVDDQFVPAKVKHRPLPVPLSSGDYLLVLDGKNHLMTNVNKGGVGSFMIKDVGRLPIINRGSSVGIVEDNRDGYLSMRWRILRNGLMLGVVNYSGLNPGQPIRNVAQYMNKEFYLNPNSASLFRES